MIHIYCTGALTLADTKTETYNKGTEANWNLCWYLSLCRIETST